MTTPIRTAQEAIEAATKVVKSRAIEYRASIIGAMIGQARVAENMAAELDRIASSLSQIEIAPVAAGEFVPVPREPTEAMLWAAEESKPTSVGSGFDNSHSYRRRVIKALWQEMLSAAPPPPAPESEVERLREALERIRDLSPRKANANTAVDLFLTVRAIADSALAALNSGGDGK